MKSFLLLGAFLIVLVFAWPSGAQDLDPACAEFVKAVCIPAWSQMAQSSQSVRVRCHERVAVHNIAARGAASETNSDWEILWSWSKERRWIKHAYTKSGDILLRIANNDYEFAISNKTRNDLVWTLVDATKYDETRKFSSVGLAEQFALQQLLLAPLYIFGNSILDLNGSKDFRLAVAKFEQGSGLEHQAIRLEWECGKDLGTYAMKGARYWLEVTAQSHWLPTHSGIKSPDGLSVEKIIEYQPYGDTIFQKSVKIKDLIPKFSSTATTYEFAEPQPDSQPEAEFYLPYYGIPENVVNITRTNPWVRVAAIVLSLIGVAVSIYLYRMSKKSTGPAGATR